MRACMRSFPANTNQRPAAPTHGTLLRVHACRRMRTQAHARAVVQWCHNARACTQRAHASVQLRVLAAHTADTKGCMPAAAVHPQLACMNAQHLQRVSSAQTSPTLSNGSVDAPFLVLHHPASCSQFAARCTTAAPPPPQVRCVLPCDLGVVTASRDKTVKIWIEEGPQAFKCNTTLVRGEGGVGVPHLGGRRAGC